MDYMIYVTERCNLYCRYCESAEDRNSLQQDFKDKDSLIDFLKKAPKAGIHFYGGEPLLDIDFMKRVLQVPHTHATLQTNGLLLSGLDQELLDGLDLISVSLDGPEEETDAYRGKGVYRKAISQTKSIKGRYSGMLNVRMTISPGMDIEKCVRHFIGGCEVKFDHIHWQLNALFHPDAWQQDKESIIRWFRESYNPKITSLVKMWVREMIVNQRVIKIVPFIGIMQSLLTNTPVSNVRCGAGWDMSVITTAGDVYPCPVMRFYPEFNQGNVSELEPADIKQRFMLKGCRECEVFGLCGGRCLCSNLKNEWDDEGYRLVCESVKHLIQKMVKAAPIVKKLIALRKIPIEEFDLYQAYEVIP